MNTLVFNLLFVRFMNKCYLLINKLLHLFEVMRVPEREKNVYLTFDDGPEEEITDYVLDVLSKYNFKATFFCKGCNIDKYSNILLRINKEGHAVGNHTYSHLNGFDTTTKDYLSDVEKADAILQSKLFRPPFGVLRLSQFLFLKYNKYHIVHWSLDSGDSLLDAFDLTSCLKRIKNKTRKGDVVLFHCCKRHEKETKALLPLYLEWLADNGYNAKILK